MHIAKLLHSLLVFQVIQHHSVTQTPYNSNAINLSSEKLVKEQLRISCESSFTNQKST